MGKDTLEKWCNTVRQVAMNCFLCIAILLTTDIPAVSGSLWVWIPPMSTDIRVHCCPRNCHRDTLCSSSGRSEGSQLTLTLGQPKTFKLEADTPHVNCLLSYGWALLPLPWDVPVRPTRTGGRTPPAPSMPHC